MKLSTLHGSDPLPIQGARATVGRLSFPAGTRLPAQGVSVHEQDEISFIHAGVLRAHDGVAVTLVRAGDVTFIPAGEPHWAEVVEDVTLSYVLLDKR